MKFVIEIPDIPDDLELYEVSATVNVATLDKTGQIFDTSHDVWDLEPVLDVA